MNIPAVVVGLCAHGLAVVRALGRAGVPVTALEARDWLPGVRTRWARVRIVQDINGLELLDALDDVLPPLGHPSPPVLFLTNDNMVRVVASGWRRIEERCRLSWSQDRDAVAHLLDKRHLVEWCDKKGLQYPDTILIDRGDDLVAAAKRIDLPVIVKPTKPLSSFKAVLCRSAEEVASIALKYEHDFPLLLQQYIPGDDRSLRFGALYLDSGSVLARFEGRKLRSYPAVGGGTSVAEPFPDDKMFEMACRFFDGLNMSGPVSLEVKVDKDGTMWVVEPTVGRTDYWLDCCVANGVNFPLMEYNHQSGSSLLVPSEAKRSFLWVDSERDKLGVLSLFSKDPGTGSRVRFSYLSRDDVVPFLKACVLWVQWTWDRCRRRLIRVFSKFRINGPEGG